MLRRNFLIALGLGAAMAATAATISPQEALQRARVAGPSFVKGNAAAQLKPVYTATSAQGLPAAYVFNTGDAGYMILSADDIAYPVLGYSETGSIDGANIAPELQWWLSEYGRQIEWAAEKGARKAYDAPTANADWTAIAPLLTTKWDQSEPYSNKCPEVNGTRCVTGCVATSMAQVMNYFKYPEVGQGMVSYRCSSINRKLSLNFAKEPFDWDHMLNVYSAGNYTDEEANAVAYLMKACGYSVEMNYTTQMSGASGSDIAVALVKYFKYSENIRDYRRITFSGTQWTEMVYDNLKNVGPVIINGQAPNLGGHSFVCDGYDGKGYFHFNWGWSGVSDGYYALDALNPDAQGIGGYAGGFNFQQNAIFGIMPPDGSAITKQPANVLQYGTTVASISGRQITFDVADYSPLGWGNATDREIEMKMGAIITPIDGTAGNEQRVDVNMGVGSLYLTSMYSYYPNTSIHPKAEMPAGLGDGKYRVTLAAYEANVENAEWLPVAVPWGYQNSCILEVNSGVCSVSDIALAKMKIADLEPTSEMYSSKNIRLQATFTNDSDVELVKGVCPILSGGGKRFSGESILITLQPGETAVKDWISKFYNYGTETLASVSTDTEMTLTLYDPETGLTYDGVSTEVTFKPNPGAATLQLTNFTIVDAPKTELDANGVHYYVVYEVNDLSKIPFRFGYKITKGYFDGAISFSVYKQDPTNPNNIIPVEEQIYTDMPFAAKGTEKEVDIDINFSQGADDTVYFIYGIYTLGSRENFLGQCPFICNPSGIDEIGIDTDAAELELYNVQGQRVKSPSKGDIIIVKQGSKTWKMVWK